MALAGFFLLSKFQTQMNIQLFIPAILAIIFIATTFFHDPQWRFSKTLPNSINNDKAVNLMKDWAIWMSGMETAIFGFFGYLLSKGGNISENLILPFASVITFTGLALVFSSYILAALPSVSLRLTSYQQNDIYEIPLFNWTTKIKLGYIAALQHVFWFLSIISVAWYFLQAIDVK